MALLVSLFAACYMGEPVLGAYSYYCMATLTVLLSYIIITAIVQFIMDDRRTLAIVLCS